MNRFLFTVLACLVASAAFCQGSGSLFSGLWGDSENEKTLPIQNVVIPKLPAEADFAGERVPLE